METEMSLGSRGNKKIDLNRVCRSCLATPNNLKDITMTKLPKMMETVAAIKVSEDDDLPLKICVTCFHLISKFYVFKKKMENTDRILRNYLQSLREPKQNDIIHIALNDAEIKDETNDGYLSDEDIPLSKRLVRDEPFSVLKNLKVDKISISSCKPVIDSLGESSSIEAQIFTDISTPFVHENISSNKRLVKDEPLTVLENLKLEKISISSCKPMIESLGESSGIGAQIFTDGPPPLVPLEPQKKIEPLDNPLKNLPKDTPPLIPIKPISNLEAGESLEIKLKCPTCLEEFSSVAAVKEHKLNNCQPLNALQCNICHKEFKESKKLLGHLKGHMLRKDYCCKICHKRYPNPSTMKIHMRTHTGERPFKCEICNKGFVRYAGVVGHMRTHQSDKPFKCETCGRCFKVASNLERHKVLHSNSLPFCCNYCGKTFSQSDNLRLHIKTYHTNERPYLCYECGKGFVSSNRLNRHMWIHTGYKPYKCMLCPKAYSNSIDLKNHERSHSGQKDDKDKVHACNVCEMRFYHPCRLARHLKTHKKPYSCNICADNFKSESTLNKHIENKHSVIIVDGVLPDDEIFVQYQ